MCSTSWSSRTRWLIGAAVVLLVIFQISKVDAQAVSQCGRRKTNRIVGGYNTIVNEYPMMAGLIYGKVINVFCGAIIVSSQHIVSAAHCFSGRTLSQISALVGDYDYNTGADTPYAALYTLSYLFVHPSYRQGDDYDVAVARTTTPITFNAAVGPVCLPYGQDQFENRYVDAVGWGTLSFGGRASNILQKVTLQVISNADCARYFGNRITIGLICTYMPSRDSCQQDSGGPLFMDQGGLVYLVGIIAFGKGCANGTPSVSTRVTYYADWIRANMR